MANTKIGEELEKVEFFNVFHHKFFSRFSYCTYKRGKNEKSFKMKMCSAINLYMCVRSMVMLNMKYMHDENGCDMFICKVSVHIYILLYESFSHTHILVYATIIRTYTMSFDLYSKIKNIRGMSFLNINNPMYWSSFYVLECMYTLNFTLSKNPKIFCFYPKKGYHTQIAHI